MMVKAQGSANTHHDHITHHGAEAPLVIHARALSKWYGQVIALNNLYIDIKPGITGIVGPNGSGKSTLFNVITGMVKQNMGDIHVLNERPWDNHEIRARIGFCPDYDNLSDEMTGRDFMELVGGLHALSGEKLSHRIKEVGGVVGMTSALDRKMGGYSKGMRQRMKIAVAILHEPELLLLDEPLSGTDPVARHDLIELIKSLNRDHGHNIIVSSHVLFEIERMTRDVVLLFKGRVVASGGVEEIRGLIDKHPHNIVLEGDNMLEMAKRLLERDFTISLAFDQNRKGLRIETNKPDEFFSTIPDLISESGCRIYKMYSLDDSLEAVFKYLVGWHQ